MAASPAPIEAKEALLFDLPEPEAIDPAQRRARSTRFPRFLSSDRRQIQMLPPTIDELLPPDHIARHVVEFIESSKVDLSAFNDSYAGYGSAAYPPAMLLSLLLYCSMEEVYSTRKMERLCRFYDPCKFICNSHVPDHSTIHRFRKRFGKEIQALFLQVTRSLMEEHTSVVLSLDGTKILASASRSRSCTWNQLEDKESFIRAQIKHWDDALDLAEAEAETPSPSSAPEEQAQTSQTKAKGNDQAPIQERGKAVATKKDASQAKTDASLADVESAQETAPSCKPVQGVAEIRKQRDRKKKELAQITQAKAQLQGLADERFEQRIEEYEGKMAVRATIEEETGKKIPGRKPKPPEWKPPRDTDRVNLTDPDSHLMPHRGGFEQAFNGQAAVCHDTRLIVSQHVSQKANDKQEVAPTLERLEEAGVGDTTTVLVADAGYFSTDNVAHCEARGVAPLISPCSARRASPRPKETDTESVAVMKWWLRTPSGRALYAERKSTVETVFGILKNVMGFRRFMTRSLASVSAE